MWALDLGALVDAPALVLGLDSVRSHLVGRFEGRLDEAASRGFSGVADAQVQGDLASAVLLGNLGILPGFLESSLDLGGAVAAALVHEDHSCGWVEVEVGVEGSDFAAWMKS